MPAPKMPRSSAALRERFGTVAAGIPGAQLRKMFGYDCFFVGGNYAAGLWRETVVFKLSDEDLEEFLAIPGAKPFAPMKGRVMRQWGEAPEALAASPARIRTWALKAAAYAASLPRKGAGTGSKGKTAAKKTAAPKRSR